MGEAPSADLVLTPDTPSDGGLLDQAAEVVSSDRPDAVTEEDALALDDLPSRDDAPGDGPGRDGERFDAPEDRGASPCTTFRFEAPARHALPSGYMGSGFTSVGTTSSCSGGAGRPAYALYDMNADQRPDLVVTLACDNDAVGADHWRVYLNTGAAFTSTATRFAVPSGYGRGFTSVGTTSSCSGGAGRPAYALYDMNADQRPDLVVTRACDDDTVGADHWRVYLNTGSAFASTATRFALPSGYTGSGFTSAGASSSCSGGAGRPGYALYDMNADQRPDLVVTQACEDAAVGSDHWRVHLNVCM